MALVQRTRPRDSADGRVCPPSSALGGSSLTRLAHHSSKEGMMEPSLKPGVDERRRLFHSRNMSQGLGILRVAGHPLPVAFMLKAASGFGVAALGLFSAAAAHLGYTLDAVTQFESAAIGVILGLIAAVVAYRA